MKIKDSRGKFINGMPDNSAGRCVAISNNDTIIVVGMRGGHVRVYECDPAKKDLGIKYKKTLKNKYAKGWVSEIKFSPNDEYCAIGDHKRFIYIYATRGKRAWKLKGKDVQAMQKHSSAILHMDWSVCGEYLQSVCQAYEILFWDVKSRQQLPGGASSLKNEKWFTWTCKIGFPVQEIWRGTEGGDDVNAVDRSHFRVME